MAQAARRPITENPFAKLEPRLQRQLLTYCEVAGEDPWDIIDTALTLHFDKLEAALCAGDVLVDDEPRATR